MCSLERTYRCDVTTMHRAVQRLDLRRKTLYADEQDTPRVIDCGMTIAVGCKIDVQNLVFVDEAGLNLSMTLVCQST